MGTVVQESPLNSHGKCAEKSCELSEPILHYVFTNDRELCPEQACKLSGACKLTRVKLSGLYCVWCFVADFHFEMMIAITQCERTLRSEGLIRTNCVVLAIRHLGLFCSTGGLQLVHLIFSILIE